MSLLTQFHCSKRGQRARASAEPSQRLKYAGFLQSEPQTSTPLETSLPAVFARPGPGDDPPEARLSAQPLLRPEWTVAALSQRAQSCWAPMISGRVIATKGFDATDGVLRVAIRDQVGSVVKRLRREGAIENLGAGRASKWKLANGA